MSFNMERLLCLLDHGNVSKDELVSAMNQIQFRSTSSEHNEALLTNHLQRTIHFYNSIL